MEKGRVILKDKKFFINETPIYFNSGEIHYFRIKENEWKDRIKKAKEAGLNTIASYIPWIWHEINEGAFDFTGKTHPQRNVIKFINLINEAGMYFLPRIGPISNGEITGEGLPTWLTSKYPEVHIKDPKGNVITNPTMMSYLNPTFQGFVSKWYDKVLPIIKENLTENGGPIGIMQLCNEIAMIQWLAKGPDYSENTTKLFQNFLKNKYKSIAVLNETYGSSFKSFDEIRQPMGDTNTEGLSRCLDFASFYREYYALYFKSLADRVRQAGIDIPLSANIPGFYDYMMSGRGNQGLMCISMFHDFSKYTPNTIFGGAYQMRRLDFENFHDAILMTEMMKTITSPGAPTICAEMQIGGMNDRPRLYEADVELNIKYSTAHGLNSINGYMFCGGTNDPLIAQRSSYHEWQAPIDSKGNYRSHMKPLKMFGKFIGSFNSLLADTDKMYDNFAMGYYQPYYTTEYLSGRYKEEFEAKRDRYFFDGPARLLHVAGFNFPLVDIEKATIDELLKHKILWIFSIAYMDGATQKKLADYVKKGGTLVVNPLLPTKDLNLKNNTTLQDDLGIKITKYTWNNLVYSSDKIVSTPGKDILADFEQTIVDPKGATVLAWTKDKEPCAILKNVEKGKVLFIGFYIPHTFDYHIDVAKNFAELVGAKRNITVKPYDIHAVLRKTDNYGFLSITNFNDTTRDADVTLTFPGESKPTTLRSIHFMHRDSYLLPLNVQIAKDVVARFATCEIIAAKWLKNVLNINVDGSRDGKAAVSLKVAKKPKAITLNNEKLKFTYKNGTLDFSFMLNGNDEIVQVKF